MKESESTLMAAALLRARNEAHKRDTFISASHSPIARCDECERYAIPGQFLCTQCMRP